MITKKSSKARVWTLLRDPSALWRGQKARWLVVSLGQSVTKFCWEHSWKEVIVSTLVLISPSFYPPLSPLGVFLDCSLSRQDSANAILKSGLQVSWYLPVHKAPFTWAEDTHFNFFFWLRGSYVLKDSRPQYRKLIGLNRIFFFCWSELN